MYTILCERMFYLSPITLVMYVQHVKVWQADCIHVLLALFVSLLYFVCQICSVPCAAEETGTES